MRLDTIIKLSSLIIIIFFCGCKSKNNPKLDTPNSGTIYISVDQSFKPVIEQEIRMYELSYPNTHIIASYKSESECFKDFFKDTLNRVIIVGRGLNSKEEHFMIDSIGYNPACNSIATDAVAIILNKKNPDSLFTIVDLKNQLVGKVKSNKVFVFDGLNATSTVRYIKGKILEDAKYVVDMSVIKNDGGGSQYTFLEAMYEKCALVINKKWVDSSKTEFVDNKNCFVVADEEELVSLLNKDPNTSSVVRGANQLLQPHISVDWPKQLASYRL